MMKKILIAIFILIFSTSAYSKHKEEEQRFTGISYSAPGSESYKKLDTQLIDNKLYIKFRDKFNFRRGRVNCSLNDDIGWRWLGMQFSIKQN